MTFDDNITTDLGTAIENWHTAISGMSGFTTLDSDFSDSIYRFFSFTTPTEHSDTAVILYFHADYDRFYLSTGKETHYSYDSANDTVPTFTDGTNTRKIENLYGTYEAATDYTTNVRYWLQYDSDGFALACRREAGDGSDSVITMVYENLTKLCNYAHNDWTAYTNSNGNEAPLGKAIALVGDGSNLINSNVFGTRVSQASFDPEGDGFNYWGNAFYSLNDQYGGSEPILATGSKLIESVYSDNSVSNHDTITQGGTPVYKILKYPRSELYEEQIALSMK